MRPILHLRYSQQPKQSLNQIQSTSGIVSTNCSIKSARFSSKVLKKCNSLPESHPIWRISVCNTQPSEHYGCINAPLVFTFSETSTVAPFLNSGDYLCHY